MKREIIHYTPKYMWSVIAEIWLFTCTGHRNQGKRPAPPLNLFFPGELASSSSVQRRWTSVLRQMHCLQGTEVGKKTNHKNWSSSWIETQNVSFDSEVYVWLSSPPRSHNWSWSRFPLPEEDFLDLVPSDEDFLVLLKLYTLAFCGLGFWINDTKKEVKTNL